MGFGFRKTFSSGPFRFTVSPSGVSSSFGVRGARISSGPRGTFVTVSSHGAYYRHRIDNHTVSSHPNAQQQSSSEQPTLDSVFQVPIAELIASNQSELVDKLNANVAATNPAIFVFILSGLCLLIAPSFPIAGIILALIGILCGAVLFSRFKASHTQEIHYSLDTPAAANFEKTQTALATLASCSNVWALNTRSATSDQKRNAGAGMLITRKSAYIGNTATEGFRSSLPFSSIGANSAVLHFLPDQILIFSNKKYASVSYEQLGVDIASTRYIETEGVPRDSTQVDTTWRFVNKNGGPDRRFNDNSQIPVLRYGEVTLRTATGFQVILQTSSYEKATAFASRFRIPTQTQNETYQNNHKPKQSKPVQISSTLLECYTLLGVTRPSTLEQASAAHRHQAMLYHPDKYDHLAPEMKALASVKMQEINAAFSRVKADIEGH